MMIIWSYGGGVQSVAIGVLIQRGELPMPDLTVIADTGREVETTWDYLETTMRPFLSALKIERISASDYATVDLYRNEDLLIPAFTRQTGKLGRLPTFCSNEWKRRVIMRWIRAQGVTEAAMWLGISTDELERMKPSDVQWLSHVYPLIELRPTNRRQCVELIMSAGLPVPHKSRCWMCPHQNKKEWTTLSAGDIERAVAFDEAIRKQDAAVYVHYSGKPLVDAVNEPELQMSFDGCDSGVCWT
jgi:hypothetical protein